MIEGYSFVSTGFWCKFFFHFFVFLVFHCFLFYFKILKYFLFLFLIIIIFNLIIFYFILNYFLFLFLIITIFNLIIFIFNYMFFLLFCKIVSGYTIVSLCQDTQLCLGLFLLFKHFSFFSFFKAFSFNFLFSIIEIFQMPSTENYIQVQNSVVCLEGTLLCPAAFLRSWFFDFFQSFPLPFPLLAKVFSFQLISFLVSFIWNSQKWPVSQNIWCLIKTQLKNITQTILQGGSPWATLIHNSVVCFEGTLLCPDAFLRSWFFDFFQSFPLPFPLLAKVFSFQLISFLVSFIWNSQKWPVSQNIWCLIKTQLKNITQTIFQGGSPWATLIHNSVVCLRVHYCVQLLSWGHDFLIFFNHFLYLFLC